MSASVARTADEATLKFAITAGLSLGLTMFGFVFLYAMSGTTTLSAMNFDAAADANHSALRSVALILLITGLAIPLSVVPFHFAMVDIVDGVDGWTAGVMSLLPRLAAAAALLRICLLPSLSMAHVPVSLLLVLAVTTMLGGGFMALTQTRVQRLFAYLGIAQTGWWLLGSGGRFVVGGTGKQPGIDAGLRRLDRPIVGDVDRARRPVGGIRLSGRRRWKMPIHRRTDRLARTHPALATAVALFLFSLASIPPLLGFWSQAALLWTALAVHVSNSTQLIAFHRGFVSAAGAGVVGGLIVAAVAVRTVSLMFFQAPLSKPQPRRARGAHIVAIALTIAILGAGLFPQALWNWLVKQ